MSKVKSEVKTTAHRASQLETHNGEMTTRLTKLEKELSESKLLVQQVRMI